MQGIWKIMWIFSENTICLGTLRYINTKFNLIKNVSIKSIECFLLYITPFTIKPTCKASCIYWLQRCYAIHIHCTWLAVQFLYINVSYLLQQWCSQVMIWLQRQNTCKVVLPFKNYSNNFMLSLYFCHPSLLFGIQKSQCLSSHATNHHPF